MPTWFVGTAISACPQLHLPSTAPLACVEVFNEELAVASPPAWTLSLQL
jgi:hypothetical protein